MKERRCTANVKMTQGRRLKNDPPEVEGLVLAAEEAVGETCPKVGNRL
jgi:hypothetical protein